MKTLIVLFASLAATPAIANSTRCFEFDFSQTPERTSTAGVFTDTWCYEVEEKESGQEVFIYFADAKHGINRKLAALVETDAAGKPQSVSYEYLVKGESKQLKTAETAISPLPVPLSLEDAEQSAQREVPAVKFLATNGLRQDLKSSLAQTEETLPAVKIEEGESKYYLADELLPHDAHWWPYSPLELAAGPFSPLGKYDAMIEARTGSNPQSVEWEASHHHLNVAWGGHCNGWAASAVLHKEVSKPRYDPETGLVLLTSDFNGMLAEASFCVHWNFYGRRYYGREGEDSKDIYPDLFHKVLIKYLRDEKKPIALDRIASDSVDNSVITGVTFKITPFEDEENAFAVHANTKVHFYHFMRNENLGPAMARPIDYRYILRTDAAGEIVSGEWLSENPDFLWIPLEQRKCGRENPRIDHEPILKWMEELPEVAEVSKDIGFNLAIPLQPRQEVDLPLLHLEGVLAKINFGSVTTGPEVVIRVEGVPLYPSQYNKDNFVFTLNPSAVANQAVELPIQKVKSFKLVNQSDRPSSTGLEIKSMTFSAGTNSF